MADTMTMAATEASNMAAAPEVTASLTWVDLVVIIVYFIFVIGVGVWASRRSAGDSVSGYFLASRNMHWIPVGASLFASNIGSGHFIGLAGSGAASGIGVAGFENSAVYILMLLGWVFVPVYMSSGIYTMPEYLRERFGGQRIRIYLSFLALLLYIFTKISADLYAGALFIQLSLGKTSTEWLYISVCILLAIAALFTIAGGLTAVIWTDCVQTVLMIIGSCILMIKSFNAVEGYEGLVEKYPYAVATIRAVDKNNQSCGEPPSDYMNLVRSVEPGESDLPWTGMLFGLTINSIWYWCTDQVIVQRTLASKNMVNAKAGCVLAGYLKFLPMWLLVFPGMAARILFPERVACASPEECLRICSSEKGCTNIAYAELVIKLLPQGLSGMMMAVMLAALMSSLTSIFNSASTIFTIDVWSKIRSKATDEEKLLVGRCFVIALVAVSVVWIPVIQNSGTSQLFDYIQSISSFLAPPICAVYVLAIFWDRTNEPGAFWGLMLGLVLGLTRFAMEFSYTIPACGSDLPDPRPDIIKLLVGRVHYLHFSCILFLITIAITVSISLVTAPIPIQSLYRLTWSTRFVRLVRHSMHNTKKTDARTAALSAARTSDSTAVKVLRKMCCMSKSGGEENAGYDVGEVTYKTEQELADEAVDFLKEEPFWRNFVNMNAIICLTITTFVVAFYA